MDTSIVANQAAGDAPRPTIDHPVFIGTPRRAKGLGPVPASRGLTRGGASLLLARAAGRPDLLERLVCTLRLRDNLLDKLTAFNRFEE